MKRLSQTPGYTQASLESAEKMMSMAVMGFGHICPTVTDIYPLDATSLIVACFDGKTHTHYKFVQSNDTEWYSVDPTDGHPPVSFEDFLQRSIYGQGFKCSKVTDILFIKWGEIFQATCIEGKYKVVKSQESGITVTPW
jgi:hypothetical protein